MKIYFRDEITGVVNWTTVFGDAVTGDFNYWTKQLSLKKEFESYRNPFSDSQQIFDDLAKSLINFRKALELAK